MRISMKNILLFFVVCLPCAVLGAVCVHIFGLMIDTMPGGVFCVDDLCNGHPPEAYLLDTIRLILVIYLSILVWFWAGMQPARGLDKGVKKIFLILLSIAAIAPLSLTFFWSIPWQGVSQLASILLAGIATVWIPRINRRILGSRKLKK